MAFTSITYSCGPLGKVRKLLNLNHGNWTNVPVPQASTFNLLDVETNPTNGNHVYVVGEGSNVGFYGVAVSTDGGLTWNNPGGNYQTVSANTPNFRWNEIMVINSTTSIIVGGVSSLTDFGTIAKSTDGGLTYNLLNWQNNLTNLPGPANTAVISRDCTSVHFPTASIGVVALGFSGLTTFVIKTTDGGGTWTVMNGAQPLSTTNPSPGTILLIGNITGINILPDESHVIGVGLDFIVETIPGNPGMLVDTWRNNFITSTPPGSPPVYSGFTNNQSIGFHLNGLPSPNEQWIYVSGNSELGIHSNDHGQTIWTTPNPPGWSIPGPGTFTRQAAHFYLVSLGSLTGFYNKDQTVYWSPTGFAIPETLSDSGPGLDYRPNALWTYYNEIPEVCYQLVNCVTGSITITNTNLSAYVGLTITIVEQPGQCFVVQPSNTCAGTVAVTFSAQFEDCQTCSPPVPCSCPPGTTQVTLPNGSIVCREDSVTLAQSFDPLEGCEMIAEVIGCPTCSTGNFNQNALFNQFGANIYQNISSKPWPITPFVDPSCILTNFYFKDNSAGVVAITNSATNSLWGDGLSASNGRHNNAAVWNHFWTPSTCAANPNIGLYGFTYCLTVSTQAVYYFATSGRNFQLKINGTVAIENTSGSNFGINNLHIFPITLAPGTYIIEANGAEVGTGICNSVQPFTTGFVWEIYTGVGLTPASLAAMTLPGQLAAVTVYSTLSESGNKFDYGSVTYNHRCPGIGQALDNCFANVLNPNANPNIYVCHSYIDTPIKGCCYILTDCQNPAITYITSTDLSTYVFQNNIITVSEYVGCFSVSLAPSCGPIIPPTVTVVQSYLNCDACLPKCYLLTDCDNEVTSILTNTDLSAYLGLVINIEGSTTCWQVSLAGGCQGSVPVTLTNSFATCTACKPVCYLLVDCKDPNSIKVTNTNLSAYVGQVIYIEGCPGVCWQVNIAPDCDGAVSVIFQESFADCETCSPTPPKPPVELRPRLVKPGYYTPGCSTQYTEKVYCNFANAVYDEMVIKRYGVTMCCNEPVEKWDIKRQLLELTALYDPELCKNTFDKCCPPCAMKAELIIFNPITCNPPTNMNAMLQIPSTLCPAPTNMQGGISIP